MADDGDSRGLLWVSAVVALILGAWFVLALTRGPERRSAIGGAAAAAPPPHRDGHELFGVSIRDPGGPPRAVVGVDPIHGGPVTASCTTCHATRDANHDNVAAADLDEFHQGLTFAHGTLNCLSCHNPDNYDQLRLADQSPLEFTGVMRLCAQCHGAVYDSYTHGAHGGMNGYWDLSRGPRTRNTCTDCHDSHAPAFATMVPTFKPIDRFLTPETTEHD